MPPSTTALRGRAAEREILDQALRSARGGESAVLTLRGEAGIGKTALLDYLAGSASGCRLIRIAGMESELELPLAAVHQLCAPMLDLVGALPEPQQQALRVAFGDAIGSPPDRFALGLAVLGLLAEATAERPLVCLVDDAQWLDQASAQVIGFVARRLAAEPVCVVFAVREAADTAPDLRRHLATSSSVRVVFVRLRPQCGPYSGAGPRSRGRTWGHETLRPLPRRS